MSTEALANLQVGRYGYGDYVKKVRGSEWHGRVVGFYATELTAIGYAVESAYECGSVQIYPEVALQPWNPKHVCPNCGHVVTAEQKKAFTADYQCIGCRLTRVSDYILCDM